MNAWKYEIISRVEQDISLVRFAHSWDILVNTWNKFHISANLYALFWLFNYAHTYTYMYIMFTRQLCVFWIVYPCIDILNKYH